MKEKTLGIIKPDAVARGIIGEILAVVESEQLNIIGIKMMRLEKKTAEELYKEHRGKSFFDSLIESVTSGNIVVFVVEGKNAISKYKEMVGHPNPIYALEGTLRKLFALSVLENSVHASSNSTEASREVSLVFE